MRATTSACSDSHRASAAGLLATPAPRPPSPAPAPARASDRPRLMSENRSPCGGAARGRRRHPGLRTTGAGAQRRSINGAGGAGTCPKPPPGSALAAPLTPTHRTRHPFCTDARPVAARPARRCPESSSSGSQVVALPARPAGAHLGTFPRCRPAPPPALPPCLSPPKPPRPTHQAVKLLLLPRPPCAAGAAAAPAAPAAAKVAGARARRRPPAAPALGVGRAGGDGGRAGARGEARRRRQDSRLDKRLPAGHAGQRAAGHRLVGASPPRAGGGRSQRAAGGRTAPQTPP
jgi:hypothetical protein